MSGKRRFGQRTWHFSDAGNKFDGKPRNTPSSNIRPISPALKRGVIRCKRCGSRVVSNLDNCPFCGKSLKPFFARLWFWIIVVIVAVITAIVLINTFLPDESTEPPKPNQPELAVVVGKDPSTPAKQLEIGSAVAVGGLQVRVLDVALGPIASTEAQLVVVSIEFTNHSQEALALYSTQWMMKMTNNKYVYTFVGAAQDGATISSNFEAYQLAANSKFTGRLYFAGSDFSEVVFYPGALANSENLQVTWTVPDLNANQPQVEKESTQE